MAEVSGTEDTALQLATTARVASTHALSAGDVVGRYEIVALSGQGGMGDVYRARDRALGRTVALKLVRGVERESGGCGVMCSLLLREAQTMARLSHPALATVHDVGEHQGCVYVAMEYVDGVTLRAWAVGRPWQERLSRLVEVGRALAAAHAEKIIHRDVKPDNVLVEKGGRVVVMDFGIARSLADRNAPMVACGCASETVLPELDDLPVGTPQYMSPEQFEGKPADGRSDQFSFAVSAWEILYGVRPFDGASPVELYQAIQAQRLTRPPDADVPAAVAEILLRGLRPSPSSRYVSMADLVRRLEAAAEP